MDLSKESACGNFLNVNLTILLKMEETSAYVLRVTIIRSLLPSTRWLQQPHASRANRTRARTLDVAERRLSETMTFMDPYGVCIGTSWSVHKASRPRFSDSHKSTQLDRLGPVFRRSAMPGVYRRNTYGSACYRTKTDTRRPRWDAREGEEGRSKLTHIYVG